MFSSGFVDKIDHVQERRGKWSVDLNLSAAELRAKLFGFPSRMQ